MVKKNARVLPNLLAVRSRSVIIPRMPRIYPDLNAFFRDNPEETVLAVAKDVACSPPMLSMVRWGRRQPRLQLALKISRRCNVPLESLIKTDAVHESR